MVGSTLFSYIDERLRKLFKPNEFFGGISIIAFGDFNQLPPVDGNPIYKASYTKNTMHKLAYAHSNPRWELFHAYRLAEIMRQRDDKNFAELLTNLGNGIISDEEIKILEN